MRSSRNWRQKNSRCESGTSEKSRSKQEKCWRRRRLVNELVEEPFLKFLDAGVEKGGFETDDALAALLPLMKQVHVVHQAAQVAPLDGVKHLALTEQGHLTFAADQALPPKKN